jgi:hypothetical protein
VNSPSAPNAADECAFNHYAAADKYASRRGGAFMIVDSFGHFVSIPN